MKSSSDFKLSYHLNSHKIFFYLFIITFACQIIFWKKTENIKPEFEILPPPPTQYFIRAASLGDDEFLFRILATRLQNAGDVFAGFVSLKNYNYSYLYGWMKALDELNYESNLAPSLAAYYYAQTQKKEDTKYVLQYLDEHASQNIDEKWWWMFQAIYIAKNSLHDMDLALSLAYKLSQNNSKTAPLWTKQMPAFIHEERRGKGDECFAFEVIENLIHENESGERKISPEEMNFMRGFINERLKKMRTNGFNPKLCKKNLHKS